MSASLIFDLLSGAMVGAVFGSFFSAWAWAIAADSPFWRKRSVCDQCGVQITPAALIPVFGFLLFRGKCRACGRPIPIFHFLNELLPACVGAALAWRYGATPLALCYAILAAALIAACAVDCLRRFIPDAFALGACFLLPLVLWLNPVLGPLSSLLGFAICGGVALALRLFFKYARKKEALGMGDVKLFAVAGAYCGVAAAPCLFLLSACGGIVAFLCLLLPRGKNIWNFRLPFGPFIGAAWIAILVFPDLPIRLGALVSRF